MRESLSSLQLPLLLLWGLSPSGLGDLDEEEGEREIDDDAMVTMAARVVGVVEEAPSNSPSGRQGAPSSVAAAVRRSISEEFGFEKIVSLDENGSGGV